MTFAGYVRLVQTHRYASDVLVVEAIHIPDFAQEDGASFLQFARRGNHVLQKRNVDLA